MEILFLLITKEIFASTNEVGKLNIGNGIISAQ